MINSNWVITKDIEFAYGHRVWTQSLNGEYADDLKVCCRHLHGHEGRVEVSLTANTLDQTGMITDFRHLEWFKQWINQHVDHKFIIDINDPLYAKLIGYETLLTPVIVPNADFVAGRHVSPKHYQQLSGAEQEYFEGFLIVDFVPTSENLSCWIAELVNAKMSKLNVRVQSVVWNETPKSRSQYMP